MAVITVEAEPTLAQREVILELLTAHNARQTGAPSGYRPLAILIRDAPDAPVIGGLWGEIYFGWLFVELLFVPEVLRNQGTGTRLLGEAEAIAREHGCHHVWLDTFSFQAPAFYRRHGYSEFGRLHHYPGATERIYFQKAL